MSLKKNIKKAWRFLWYSDSWISWVLNVLLAFVIIKFLLYPGLGFAFQTDFPIVAVVSGSMEHASQLDRQGDTICGVPVERQRFFDIPTYWQHCGSWYAQRGISLEQFSSFPFTHGFYKGDVMVLYGTPFEALEVGDVVVFIAYDGRPIIHRVVGFGQDDDMRYMQTKGDSNPDMINQPGVMNEFKVVEEQYIGRAVWRIPVVGYVKIMFHEFVVFINKLFF
ncbi:MAG: hypothetical protein ACMXYC_00655 [Candidatus Woesearchaeota archaeon]